MTCDIGHVILDILMNLVIIIEFTWFLFTGFNSQINAIITSEKTGEIYHFSEKIRRIISLNLVCIIITPHAQRKRGKVIGVGVHIICLYVCGPKKKFESYFSD